MGLIQKPRVGVRINPFRAKQFGCIGAWVMNAGSAKIYDSMNYRTCTTTGTLLAGPGYIEFSGSGYYTISGHETLMETLPYSVAFKFMTHNVPGDVLFDICGKDDSPNDLGWWFASSTSDSTGNLRFGTHTGNIKTTGIAANTWYSVVLVQKTESLAYIYVDGLLNSSGDNGFDGHAVGYPLIIGSRDTQGNPLDGYIENFYYFNQALTPQQITLLYQNPDWFKRDSIWRYYQETAGGKIPRIMHHILRR